MSHWAAFWPPSYNVKRGHGDQGHSLYGVTNEVAETGKLLCGPLVTNAAARLVYSHELADETTSHQSRGNSTGYLSAVESTLSWQC